MTKTTDKPLFTSLHNLEHHFTNEQDCWDYLVQTRWGKEPACPKCGSLEYYTIKGRKEFKCKDCKKFYNVLTGTLFENTKIPLIKWFKAIYLLTSHKKGISSHQLARDLGLTQKSGWFVLSRIRHLAQDKVPFMLSNTVQIDETYVGGKISNKHQSVRARLKRGNAQLKNENKTIVLGLVEQQGNIVNKVIPTTFSEHILPVIEQHVAKGSTMVTDDLKVITS